MTAPLAHHVIPDTTTSQRQIDQTVLDLLDIRDAINWHRRSLAVPYATRACRDHDLIQIHKLRRQARQLVAFARERRAMLYPQHEAETAGEGI